MTKKEYYNEILDTFEETKTKEEETLLYKICYSIAYTITRILLCFFGQKGVNNERIILQN